MRYSGRVNQFVNGLKSGMHLDDYFWDNNPDVTWFVNGKVIGYSKSNWIIKKCQITFNLR